MSRPVNSVDLPQGWLTGDEAQELRRLAGGKRVLELGAWKGRSTVVLAEVAAYVVSVDRHEGIAEIGGDDSLGDYLDAVRSLPNVAKVIASFAEFVPALADNFFDLVYIDGEHDFVSVQRDITLALLVDPAVVVFHDYDFEDVRRAAEMFFGEPDRVVGSVASFVRRTE